MLPRTSLLAVTSALAATALIPSSAALAFDSGNLLQSRSNGLAAFPGGDVNTSSMGRFAADQTGCRVVFHSQSNGLMTGDNDKVQNVYVRDTCAGQNRVVLVSKAGDGTPADADSSGSAISPNGRYVAFGTRASNLGGGTVTNGVYRHDLQTGETVLISASGRQHATPSVANTGAVAFSTYAAIDGTNDSGSAEDVYVRRVDDQGAPVATELVSRGDVAVGGTEPSISADGTAIGFTTAAPLAGAAVDANGANDVYVRSGDTTTLVSRSATAAVGGRLGALDADGSAVAFVAAATAELDPKDTNGKQDVYRWTSAGTTLVSRLTGPGTAASNGSSYNPAISATGDVVTFASDATDLTTPAQTGTGMDVFRRDLTANTTEIMSRAGAADFSEGAETHALSADGSQVVMLTNANNASELDEDDFTQIFARTVTTGALRHVNRPPGTTAFTNKGVGQSSSREGATSVDGRFVAFLSEGNGLADGDNDGVVNVYVRDNQTNTTEQVNVSSSEQQPTTHATEAAISDDGRRVVFATRASLSADDHDSYGDVYVRDRQTGETQLVSRPSGTGIVSDATNHSAEEVAISGDGRRVAFTTALKLADEDTNGRRDVYVRDLVANTTELATPGTAGEDPSFGLMTPALDRDGSVVAFVTPERLDPANDPVENRKDVYVRDLEGDTTQLVSRVNGAGTAAGNAEAVNPSVSADGNRIAFESSATVSPASNGQRLIHLRDRAKNETLLVSRGPGFGGTIPNAPVTRPSISADGKRVAYQTAATNASNGETPLGGVQQVWMRNLETGGTTLISRWGQGGAPGTGDSTTASISANGRCVAYTSIAPNLGLEHTAGDFTQVWLRAVDGSCPDTTAPFTTIAGPEGATTNTNPQFFLHANESGVTFECKVGDGAWASCTSPLRLTNLADGDYTVAVRGTDLAGNVEAAKTRSFTVDTRKPVLSWTTPIDSVTGDATPTAAFEADEPGVAFSCRVDGGALEPCSPPLTLAALAEGDHELTVRAADAAGNVGELLVAQFAVDLTGAVAEITDGPVGLTTDTTPQFAFASEEGATFRCAVDAAPLSACPTPWTSAALAEGEHVFRVQAIDPQGTPGPVVERTFTVDSRKPVVRWVTPIDSVTGDATPTVEFEADEEGVTFSCRLDGEDLDPCATALTLGPLSEGDHELTVRASDAAGNVSEMLTSRFAVDLTGAVAEITSGPVGTTADATPAFAFGSETGATFRCGVDTTQLAACTSPWTSGALAEGSHTFRVQAIDRQGTPGPVVQRTFTVDVPDPQPEPGAGGGSTPGSAPAGSGSSSTPRGATTGGGSTSAPVAVARLVGTSAKVKRGRVTLTVRCSGAACQATLVLKAKVGRKVVTLGRARYGVAAGKTGKVTVKLAAKGRQALKPGKRLKATAELGGGAKAALTLRG